MNYPFAEIVWINGSANRTNEDPRAAVARHIGWRKTATAFTEFTVPEPDNYNQAVMTKTPIVCDFIRDQVIYRRARTGHWWTVFYVPEEQEQQFLAWLHTLEVIVYWYSPKPIRPKEQKPYLWAKVNQAELTEHERLYTMGYYENLKSKYSSEVNKMLDSRLGVPRADISTTTLVTD